MVTKFQDICEDIGTIFSPLAYSVTVIYKDFIARNSFQIVTNYKWITVKHTSSADALNINDKTCYVKYSLSEIANNWNLTQKVLYIK